MPTSLVSVLFITVGPLSLFHRMESWHSSKSTVLLSQHPSISRMCKQENVAVQHVLQPIQCTTCPKRATRSLLVLSIRAWQIKAPRPRRRREAREQSRKTQTMSKGLSHANFLSSLF